jgi:hypothetical protein
MEVDGFGLWIDDEKGKRMDKVTMCHLVVG